MDRKGEQRKLAGRLREIPAWFPYRWQDDEPGSAAVQAVADGRATPEQQQLAIATIVEGIAEYHGLSYSPDSTHDTAFAEGKRFVGAQIVKLCKLNYSKLRRAEDNG